MILGMNWKHKKHKLLNIMLIHHIDLGNVVSLLEALETDLGSRFTNQINIIDISMLKPWLCFFRHSLKILKKNILADELGQLPCRFVDHLPWLPLKVCCNCTTGSLAQRWDFT